MTQGSDTMAEGVALRLRALAATRWIDRSDEATRAALLAGADEVERLTAELADAEARRGEERELRARMRDAHDAEMMRLRTELERLQGPAADPAERCPIGTYSATVLGHRTSEAPDLAALARREAGSAHQWRQCRRCGRCFWLTPDEAVPEHRATVLGAERACGWTVTAKESEGR